MTKNYVDDGLSEETITVEKNLSHKRKGKDMWPQFDHFKQRRCDGFSLLKANMPEMILFYLNQKSLSYKNDQIRK